VLWEGFPPTSLAAGASADVSWFRRRKLRTTTGLFLQAFVTNIFPGPSGFDYATGSTGVARFDYWTSFDFAVDAGTLSNLAFAGTEHFVCELSPSNPPGQNTVFGLNEPGPGFNVPNFCVFGRNNYQWFGGPLPVLADHWYHIDLHVIYDNVAKTFSPTLFIDGVDQGLPINHSYAPAVLSGDINFFYGSDQFGGGGGAPSANEFTWLKDIIVGTAEGASDIVDLTTQAALAAAVAAGVGDNPPASLSVLTTSPF